VALCHGCAIRAINDNRGTDLPVAPSLFVEASGSAGTVASDLELVTAIAESECSLAVAAEMDPTARASRAAVPESAPTPRSRLWAPRPASAYAVPAASRGKRHSSTDVCVPLTEHA